MEDVEDISDEILFAETERRNKVREAAASAAYTARINEKVERQKAMNMARFRVLMPDATAEQYEQFHDLFWDIVSEEQW